MMFDAKHISLELGNSQLLKDVNISASQGELVGVVGPNGAGKTSLLRSILGFEERAKGVCDLWEMSAARRSQYVAWISQDRNVNWDLSVEQIVALGRMPWRGFLGSPMSDDQNHIDRAIKQLSIEHLVGRSFHTLSGGERARVLIARALCQNTSLLLADEPIAALDPAHQLQVMGFFQQIAKDGKAVVMSIHDLGLATRFCTRIILMHESVIVADGLPSDVLNAENLASVFGIRVFQTTIDGKPVLQPIELIGENHE